MLNCSIFRHLFISVWLIFSQQMAFAQNVKRAPASYIVNDDLIVTPLEINRNFFTELNSKYASNFDEHRKIVENWQRNDEMAKQYGLEDRGVFKTTTLEQRQRFVQRNYLRFITKEVEVDTNNGIENFWNRWNTNDEAEAIKNISDQEVKISETKKEMGLPGLNSSRTANEGKDEIKLSFKPYVEMGMVKISADTDYFKIKGWFGINGNQEVNVERKILSTNTNLMFNYFLDHKRSFTIIDQEIYQNVTLRYTHDKQIEQFGGITRSGQSENNIIQIRFGMGF